MSDPTPKDLNVGQVEKILEGLPQDAVAAEQWLSPLVNKVAAELKKDSPGSVHTVDSLALKLYDVEKLINANAQAVANLTNQLAPLTFPVKGMQLHGTGQLLQTAAQVQHIPEGLKKTMTQNQHILHVVAGILQVVFLLAGVTLTFFPNIGGVGVVGGLTIVGLISAVKNIMTPFLATYGDAQVQTLQVAPTAIPVTTT